MDNMLDTEKREEQSNSTLSKMTRISIHGKYSVNKTGFKNWIYRHYNFFNGCCILELGCGNGNMWEGKIEEIGKDSALILSDISEKMLDEVTSKFGSYKNVSYKQINIEDIPYPDNSMDFVIANMLLYHVSDIHKAISEVKRVLKPNGKFYCATFGENGVHKYLMDSLQDLSIYEDMNNSFTLQNGSGILNEYFNNVLKKEYKDSLEVTDTNDLLDYIYSMKSVNNLSNVSREDLFDLFERKKVEKGFIKIPKEYGVFISTMRMHLI